MLRLHGMPIYYCVSFAISYCTEEAVEIRMIVCSCNFIREQQIRQAARDGIVAVEDIYEHLGCEPNCRQCFAFAEEIIREEIRQAA